MRETLALMKRDIEVMNTTLCRPSSPLLPPGNLGSLMRLIGGRSAMGAKYPGYMVV